MSESQDSPLAVIRRELSLATSLQEDEVDSLARRIAYALANTEDAVLIRKYLGTHPSLFVLRVAQLKGDVWATLFDAAYRVAHGPPCDCERCKPNLKSQSNNRRK